MWMGPFWSKSPRVACGSHGDWKRVCNADLNACQPLGEIVGVVFLQLSGALALAGTIALVMVLEALTVTRRASGTVTTAAVFPEVSTSLGVILMTVTAAAQTGLTASGLITIGLLACVAGVMLLRSHIRLSISFSHCPPETLLLSGWCGGVWPVHLFLWLTILTKCLPLLSIRDANWNLFKSPLSADTLRGL